MEATDLMLGDWVMFRDTPYTIATITTQDMVMVAEGERTKFYKAGSLKPIPLTREILAANGFKGDRVMEYRFEEDGETYNLYLKEMFNKDGKQDAWGTNICGVLPSIIMSVHELQHCLRLAGQKDLADNFKVEQV